MADPSVTWEASGSGRYPPAEFQDFWLAMFNLCKCYVRRELIPAEDLLQEVYLHLFADAAPVPNVAQAQFKEQLRAVYKECRRALDIAVRADATARAVGDHDSGEPVHEGVHARSAPADVPSHRDLHLDGPDGLALPPVHQVVDPASSSYPDEYTTEEAAEFLGVSRSYVIKLIKAGEIPARMVGRYRRILVTDLVAYRDKSFTKAHTALDDLSQAVRAEIEARGPTERRVDVLP